MKVHYEPTITLNQIGENLYYYRKKNGFTQKDVATYLNICPSQYKSYENAEVYMPIPMLDILSQVYMVSICHILNRQQKFKTDKTVYFV